MTTFAPPAASARTTALPIPLLPPVTMATFPFSASVAMGPPPLLSLCSLSFDECSTAPAADTPHGIYLRYAVLIVAFLGSCLLRLDEARDRFDEGEVGEGLGKVPEVLTGRRVDLLGVELQRACE